MGILSWIIVGLIAGWLATLIMKEGGYGLLGEMIIGIVGALIGGWLASLLFHVENALTGINLSTIAISVLGSVVLIALLRLIRGPRRT